MRNLYIKFRRALRRDGLGEVLRIIALRLTHLKSQKEVERDLRELEYDAVYGVDTAGQIHPTELKLSKSESQIHANRYQGTDPVIFRKAMTALPVSDYGKFTFVDYGSGKGRVLLMASEYGFKRIIGIEFSEELHRIAKNNIRKIGKTSIESICMDAMEYQLPAGPLVLYFFSPFDEVIMQKVFENISKSLSDKREAYIVYFCPRAGHLMDSSECLTKVFDKYPISIWASK